MGRIIILPEEVSMKIAAGEVIEGPCSVVRELIDNALDAEATQIRVVVNNGGKNFISVADNGCGMSVEDAALAVQKHTTSKINVIDDLRTVKSMGFRGEALASVCAVGDVIMVTKQRGDEHGTKVTCSFGGSVQPEPAPSNEGTTVMVRNLFFNLPARKKFLKSDAAEGAKVRDEVLRKALGFHERGFFYKADDRVVYSLDPHEDFRDRVEVIFGTGVKGNLLSIVRDDDLFSIKAFISNSRSTLPNRGGQYIFINRRPVADRALLFALNGPCRGVVPSGRFIYAFVFITVDPSLVDVNVHPAKKEVKIRYAQQLYSLLRDAVAKTLHERFYSMYMPGEEAGDMAERAGLWGYGVVTRGRAENRGHEPGIGAHHFHGEAGGEAEARKGTAGGEETDFVKSATDVQKVFLRQGGAAQVMQRGLFKGDVRDLHFKGQLFGTYLVFEGNSFMFFVDQHAAHERVLYERFKERSAGVIPHKRLLLPINFSPPGERYQEVLENLPSFSRAGIEIEPFGDESFNIVSLPAFVPEGKEEETLSGLFEDLFSGKVHLSAECLHEHFLELAACRAAVKEGDDLGGEEAFALLGDLLCTAIPAVCPHGRPTMVQFSKDEFERLFGRR